MANEAADIDVVYITERILVLTYPTGGSEKAYAKSLKEVVQMLKTKHGKHYKVFNVSKRRRDLHQLNESVAEFGWPEELAPPLERLCAICKQLESWLVSDRHNVVLVHSKGGRGRPALVVAAYMHYSNVCASEDQALDRFAMKRFSDDYKIWPYFNGWLRYIKYFWSLLSGETKINSKPIFLHSLTFRELPRYDGTVCNPVIKIYEKMAPVYCSGVFNGEDAGSNQLTVHFSPPLPLRGDILLKCFDWRGGMFGAGQRTGEKGRRSLFRCQFNTCALEFQDGLRVNRLVFGKDQLDVACFDHNVSDRSRLELIFALTNQPVHVDSVPCTPMDEKQPSEMFRADSYESFEANNEFGKELLTVNDNRCDKEVQSFENVDDGYDGESPDQKCLPDEPSAVRATTNGHLYSPVRKPNESVDSGISADTAAKSQLKAPVEDEERRHQPAPIVNGTQTLVDHDDSLDVEEKPVAKDQQRRATVETAGERLSRLFSSNGGPPTPPPKPAKGTTEARTPSIDVDLVGKDRYDPQSKAFSYVPAPALQQHFAAPKRQSQLIQRLEPRPSSSTLPTRTPPTPPPLPQSPTAQFATLPADRRPIDVLRQVGGDLPTTTNGTRPRGRNRRLKNYKTLDEYESDLDDLCDPDFYLSAAEGDESDSPVGRREKVVLPPSPGVVVMQRQPPTTLDGLVSSSSATSAPLLPPYSLPARPATSWSDAIDTDLSPTLPVVARVPPAQPLISRSVTSTPVQRPKTAAGRYVRSSSDMDSDSWLEAQLEKLRLRKEANDPELRRKKHMEKLLLEELKHVHDDRQQARSRDEADYTVEGYGAKSEQDPLIELRLEQERLRTAQPPDSLYQQQQSHPYVGARKPPTPPPRDRSRTPPPLVASSPTATPVQLRRLSSNASPRFNESQPTAFSRGVSSSAQHEVDRISRADHSEQQQQNIQTEMAGDFDHLESLLFNSASPLTRVSQAAVATTAEIPAASVQSPKSILKKPREESNGRSPSTPVQTRREVQRAETPSFPMSAAGGGGTPLPYHPLLYEGASDPRSPGQQRTPVYPQRSLNYRSPSPGSLYYGQSRRSSITSYGESNEVIHHHPVFIKDTSKYWYKASISREDAINILKDKPPGTFIIRDSNSFPGAFGLALKVARPPPGVQSKSGDGTELVRHFLIEPSAKGVKLKGCANEPVFGTLAALVYQHSITPMALPCKLLLPEYDPAAGGDGATAEHAANTAQALLEQGAACNVTYLLSMETESLTGPEAVRRVVEQAVLLASRKQLTPVSIHFKVSSQGVTVTDNTRRLFFRRHYPAQSVTFCGLDPDDRRWNQEETGMKNVRMFGFVARKAGSQAENVCHVFAELEPEQPASAVVNFITKVMMTSTAGAAAQGDTPLRRPFN